MQSTGRLRRRPGSPIAPTPRIWCTKVNMSELAMLKACCANPQDDLPRLVYCDWLDDNDQPEKAAFIRQSLDFAGCCPELTTVDVEEFPRPGQFEMGFVGGQRAYRGSGFWSVAVYTDGGLNQEALTLRNARGERRIYRGHELVTTVDNYAVPFTTRGNDLSVTTHREQWHRIERRIPRHPDRHFLRCQFTISEHTPFDIGLPQGVVFRRDAKPLSEPEWVRRQKNLQALLAGLPSVHHATYHDPDHADPVRVHEYHNSLPHTYFPLFWRGMQRSFSTDIIRWLCDGPLIVRCVPIEDFTLTPDTTNAVEWLMRDREMREQHLPRIIRNSFSRITTLQERGPYSVVNHHQGQSTASACLEWARTFIDKPMSDIAEAVGPLRHWCVSNRLRLDLTRPAETYSAEPAEPEE